MRPSANLCVLLIANLYFVPDQTPALGFYRSLTENKGWDHLGLFSAQPIASSRSFKIKEVYMVLTEYIDAFHMPNTIASCR